jgi:hypothetical protein
MGAKSLESTLVLQILIGPDPVLSFYPVASLII